MGHPMESHYESLRAERDRLWARRDALEKRLDPLPLSDFTVAQLPDLLLLKDRSAPGERASDLTKALDRLEAAFPTPRKKPARKRRS